MRTPNLKLLWVITLLFLAGAAYLSARVASTLIARACWVAEAPSVRASAGRSTERTVETLADYRIIAERDLFDAHPAPAPPPVAIAPPISGNSAGASAAQPSSGPATPLPNFTLVGTAVVDGGNSFALIAVGQDIRLVLEKEEVVPGAVLTQVRDDRILVTWRGKVEEIPLFDTRKVARASTPGVGSSLLRRRLRPAPPRPPEPAPPPAQAQESPGDDTVRQVGEDKWLLASEEVEQLRSNMASLMTQIRVVPNFTDGQPDGFKVFAIRPGSLFARIGLQNGDVIKRVNGLEIQGPEQAFAAYQQLSSDTNIKLDIVRRAENKTLTYEIR